MTSTLSANQIFTLNPPVKATKNKKEKIANTNSTDLISKSLKNHQFKKTNTKPLIPDLSVRIRARAWCFTLNNYKKKDLNNLQKKFKTLTFDYLCYGIESSSTGTPHLQGYASFTKRISFFQVQHFLPRAHIEPAKGSTQQNILYCSKQGQFFEFGTPPKQGNRADLTDSLAMDDDLIRKRWPLHAERLIQNKHRLHEQNKIGFNPEKIVVYLYGPSGTHKTHIAHLLAKLLQKNHTTIITLDKNGFVLGLDHTATTAILEELRAFPFTHDTLLKLCDGFTQRIPVKMGDVFFKVDLLIITSALPPDQLYTQVQFSEDIHAQILRRISVKHLLTEKDPNKALQLLPIIQQEIAQATQLSLQNHKQMLELEKKVLDIAATQEKNFQQFRKEFYTLHPELHPDSATNPK